MNLGKHIISMKKGTKKTNILQSLSLEQEPKIVGQV